MRGFLRVRLIGAIPVVIAVVTMTFLLVHLVPGDPVDHLLGEFGTIQDRAILRHELGLDVPLLQQYLHFWKGLFVGDWGMSISREQKILPLILSRFPNTALLAVLSLILSTAIALPMALLAVRNKNSKSDGLLQLFGVTTMSLPTFVVAPLLVLLFAIRLRWLPVAGFDVGSGIVLPVLCLGVLSSGLLFKMLRGSLVDCLSEDFVRTARSKGLSEKRVVAVHVLRNAAIPVLSVMGNMLGSLLSGAVVTETIFDWPGLGRLFYSAFQARDFPLVQGIVLWIALSYVLINIGVDALLSIVDPRIRLEGGNLS